MEHVASWQEPQDSHLAHHHRVMPFCLVFVCSKKNNANKKTPLKQALKYFSVTVLLLLFLFIYGDSIEVFLFFHSKKLYSECSTEQHLIS